MRHRKAALPRRLRPILCLDDFEKAARRFLPRPIFGYVSGASETNWSLEDNRRAFAEYGFKPRVLVDVSKRSTRASLFGQDFAQPFGISPMGISGVSAYRGDLVLARAAAEAQIPMIMSSSSIIRMEEVAKANPAAWFQAYLPGDSARIAPFIDRVEQAGFKTLVVTADVPVLSNRENNVRTGFSTPLRLTPRLAWDGAIRPEWTLLTLARTIWRHGMPHFENSQVERGAPLISQTVNREFSSRESLNWDHVEAIRKRWRGRLVVKGVLHEADAIIARESGADGVIVSNHGGRQLDGAISALRALPDVAAVAGGMAVMLDGGVRRGTDVLKALALGADFVFAGRPFNYAASISGEPGVRYAIELLSQEVSRDMALLGITRLEEMDKDRLYRLGGG